MGAEHDQHGLLDRPIDIDSTRRDSSGYTLPDRRARSRVVWLTTQNPECAHWRTDWACEQSVFSRYIRPTLVEHEEFIAGPCNESNGWYGVEDYLGCQGTIVSHAWRNKTLVCLELAGRPR